MNPLVDKIDDRLRNGRIGELLFAARSAAHRFPIGDLSATDQSWIEELRTFGGMATNLDELGLPITDEFRASIAEVLPTLPDAETHAATQPIADLDPLLGRNTALHCFSMDAPELIDRFPALVRFGLEERILDIVEGYLDVPVAFTALNLRKDIGGGNQVGTRFWHLDTEDVKVIRMLVYLNDVGLDDGPFEYIPLSLTNSVPDLHERAYRSAGDPIFDEEMRSRVPETGWRPVCGPAGTVLLADNAQCLHHGRVHDSERIVLIYTYTSRRPRYPRLTHNPAFDAQLSDRQRRCMFLEMNP